MKCYIWSPICSVSNCFYHPLHCAFLLSKKSCTGRFCLFWYASKISNNCTSFPEVNFLDEFQDFIETTFQLHDELYKCLDERTLLMYTLYISNSVIYVALLLHDETSLGVFLKILRISFKHHVTNEDVRDKIIYPSDHKKTSLQRSRSKLKWSGDVSRSSRLA